MAQPEATRRRTGGTGNTPERGGAQEIPDKLYFRIGEVARLCAVPAYVLRFWEGEFPQLKPNKGGTGQRLYRRRDVEMALRIKTLLYDEGYTIPGARQAFKTELRSPKDAATGETSSAGGSTIDTRHLVALQKELRDLHALLSKPPAGRSGVLPMRSFGTAPRSLARPTLMARTDRGESLFGDLDPQD